MERAHLATCFYSYYSLIMTEILYQTATEALRVVQPGNRVFIHGSAATPVCLVEALQARHEELYNVELVSITMKHCCDTA